MLNDLLPVTLQYQLRNALLQKIAGGEWKPGCLIQSERELCASFGVSRMTVREVLKDLVQEGYLVRKQGKGTYIAMPKFEHTLTSYYSLTQEIEEKGLTAKFRILNFGPCHISPLLRQKLDIPEEESALELVRLRLIGENIFYWERTVFPARLLGDATQDELEESGLYITIFRHSRLAVDEAEEDFEAVNCPHDIAALMQLPRNTAVLHVSRWTKAQGQYIEYCESYIHGEKYRYKHVLKKKGIV